MILIIDNYDSFVYNLYHWLPCPADEIRVVRNDLQGPQWEAVKREARGVIISPGPMSPHEAGNSNDVIATLGRQGVPTLGVCLGHQCIGHVFGCRVARHATPTHGKPSRVTLSQSPLFRGLDRQVVVGRYHSLCVEREGFDHAQLRITAETDDTTVMAVEHLHQPIYGVQFHPESILSESVGTTILQNFIDIVDARGTRRGVHEAQATC